MEPPQKLAHLLADKDCQYCGGDGVFGEDWGHTPDYPMSWYVFYPCGCVQKKWTNKVHYYDKDSGWTVHKLSIDTTVTHYRYHDELPF